jgi:hypothetical protein
VGNTGNNKLRNQVEQELQATIERLADLNAQLDYFKQRAFDPPSFGKLQKIQPEPCVLVTVHPRNVLAHATRPPLLCN